MPRSSGKKFSRELSDAGPPLRGSYVTDDASSLEAEGHSSGGGSDDPFLERHHASPRSSRAQQKQPPTLPQSSVTRVNESEGSVNSRDNASCAQDTDGSSILAMQPTSFSSFLTVFSYSCKLQSWWSWLLAMSFHAVHVCLVLSFLLSPLLLRSVMFSAATMDRPLLIAQGDIEPRKAGAEKDKAATTSAAPSRVTAAPVVVESVWSLHDALFFLEPGHVVKATSISKSFSKLGSSKEKSKNNNKKGGGGKSGGGGDDVVSGGGGTASGKSGSDVGENVEEEEEEEPDNTHTYVVKKNDGDAKVSRVLVDDAGIRVDVPEERIAVRHADETSSIETKHKNKKEQKDEVNVPLRFIAPPPIPESRRFNQRKRATSGQTTLSKIVSAWEASALYSSPLALTLFYYLYCMGCIILLVTVTDGKLTGHFSALRMVVVVAELFWYLHHGAHSILIYAWLLLLSHWPSHAVPPTGEREFLGRGTPYVVITRATGEVDLHWYYHKKGGTEGESQGEASSLLTQEIINTDYFLYSQGWYLAPLVTVVSTVVLAVLVLCLAKDVQRVLEAIMGVRQMEEPEGCVRCPLCGEIMVIHESGSQFSKKSAYQTAREGTSWSLRLVGWWSQRVLLTSEGSSYVAPPLQLMQPLWRWIFPAVGEECCRARRSDTAPPLLFVGNGGDGTADGGVRPYDQEAVAQDIAFYQHTSVHADQVAKQVKEERRLLRLLQPDTQQGKRGRRQHGSNSSQSQEITDEDSEGDDSDEEEEATDSSEEEMNEAGVVKVVPMGQLNAGSPSTPGLDASITSSLRRRRLRRLAQRKKAKEDLLYWNHATRHVHHRCPKLYLDAGTPSDDDEGGSTTDDDDDEEATSDDESEEEDGVARSPASAGGSSPTQKGVSSSARQGLQSRGAPVAGRHSLSQRLSCKSRDSFAAHASGSLSSISGSPTTHTKGHDDHDEGGAGLLENLSFVPDYGAMRGKRAMAAAVASPMSSSKTYAFTSVTDIGREDVEAVFYPGSSATQLLRRPVEAASNLPHPGHSRIAHREVYDPFRNGEDEFRPGNAFPCYEKAGWWSRLSFSWLNPLLSFALLEPTLLRQERFLPSLPEALVSLDNTAVPAWRLWVHRKVWFAANIAKPGTLLIPTEEVLDRAEEEMALNAAVVSDNEDDEETQSSDAQTVVVVGQGTALRKPAKLKPQRPRHSWKEQAFWILTAPLRWVLTKTFYAVYLGTSRTVRRTRHRLVRELLKDRLANASEDRSEMDGCDGVGDMEGATNEAAEATWALAEMASSTSCSSGTPSAGSALPTHMRRQLALSDVSLFFIFMEHRCGRRLLFKAGPLALLAECALLLVFPMLNAFMHHLTAALYPTLSATGDEPASASGGTADPMTMALLWGMGVGALLVAQTTLRNSFVSQAHEAAMEAQTALRSMILEKTMTLPLAQRTFTEEEVVALASDEAVRCGQCVVAFHQTWGHPLRIILQLLFLHLYVGWVAAVVGGLCSIGLVAMVRYQLHRAHQLRQEATRALEPRYALIETALTHVRLIKSALLECRFASYIASARAREIPAMEEAAKADSAVAVSASCTTVVLLLLSLGAQYLFTPNILRDPEAILASLCIFFLITQPLLELPQFFTLVARGFLSMKRIEAYLRQTPDEFTGTWVDLAAFVTEQARLREEDPGNPLLKYRRGSVVCRGSSFTWQHDLTEEVPAPMLREVHMSIRPGELVIVQGGYSAGKSTLLLAVLGEVNRCVTLEDSMHSSFYEEGPESSALSVVSSAASAEDAFVAALGPPRSPDLTHQRAEAQVGALDAEQARIDAAAAKADAAGGFLVFGSCAYCSEEPWIQNDTITTNIVGASNLMQPRWYRTVLRACRLDQDLAQFPDGDSTVVGDQGMPLTESLRCRIALARAVYSKAHIYVLDSVLTPLDPDTRHHIIREVFHRLLAKRTVILATNVGLGSLQPHRIFTVLTGGVVREDTDLYRQDSTTSSAASRGGSRSPSASPDAEEGKEEESRHRKKGHCGRRSSQSRAQGEDGAEDDDKSSEGTFSEEEEVLLPHLFAEDYEEEVPLMRHLEMASEANPLAEELLLHGDGVEGDVYGASSLLPSGGILRGAGGGAGGSTAAPSLTPALSMSGRSRPPKSVRFSPTSATLGYEQWPASAEEEAIMSGGKGLVAAEGSRVALTPLPPPMTPPSTSPPNKASTAATSSVDSRSRDEQWRGQDGDDDAASEPLLQQQQRGRHLLLYLVRHPRLSYYMLVYMLGKQFIWLLACTLVQQAVLLGTDLWPAMWIALSASAAALNREKESGEAPTAKNSVHLGWWGRLLFDMEYRLPLVVTEHTSTYLYVLVPLGLSAVFLVALRTRTSFRGIYGTVHALYNEVVNRVLRAPVPYLDYRVTQALLRVLNEDGNMAEMQVPPTIDLLLSSLIQLLLVLLWNAMINVLFVLLIPIAVILFGKIYQRHSVVVREVRRLELRSRRGTVDILREVFSGAAVVRCMGMQDHLREEYCRSLDTANTATMVAYMTSCWMHWRLHLITAMLVSSTAMLGVAFSYGMIHPSFTVVGMLLCLRAGPLLLVMCTRLSSFTGTQWVSVQRLLSLWRMPAEPLVLQGEENLTTYSHVPRASHGSPVSYEGYRHASLIHLVPSGPSPVLQEPRDLSRTQAEYKEPSSSIAVAPAAEERATPSSASSAAFSSAPPSAPSPALGASPRDGARMTLPVMELVNVSARYRRCLPFAVHHLNLAVYPGERLGIVGHSGHGKSALFNVLLRLVDEMTGRVLLDGEDASVVPYPILRSYFSLVPQDPLIMEGTWRSNLLLGFHPCHPLLFGRPGSAGPALLPIQTMSKKAAMERLKEVSVKSEPSWVEAEDRHADSPTEEALGEGWRAGRPALSPLQQLVQRFKKWSGHSPAEKATPLAMHGKTSYGATDPLSGSGTRGSGQHHHHHRAHRHRPHRLSTAADDLRRGMACCSTSLRVPEGPQQPVEDAALWDALRAVGLDGVVEFNGGLDAPLDSDESSEFGLSLHQRQLIYLARAVLRKAPFLLIEEAVHSGVGAHADRVLRRVLRRELKGTTMILIAHRLSTVTSLCTRVMAMENGLLVPVAELPQSVSRPGEGKKGEEEEEDDEDMDALDEGMGSFDHGSFENAREGPALDPEILRKLSFYVE